MKFLQNSYELIEGKVIEWFQYLVVMIPNLLLSMLVLYTFYRVGKFASKATRQMADRLLDNVTINRVLSALVYYMMVAGGLFVALKIMDWDSTVTSLLAGAGIVGLALSFAFQDLATNFISGLIIIVQKPLQIGDYVETNNYSGYVDRIDLRSITIRTLDEQHVIIPSKSIFQSPLKNYNLGNIRRIVVSVGVSYGEDLERVQRVIIKAISELEDVDNKKPVKVHFNGFGDSSVNCDVRFWVNNSDQLFFLDIRSDAIIAIRKAFDRENITIPFPIRTLDFGIKGGQKLQEMWPQPSEKNK